jgi:hypothetical protein
MVPSLRVAHSGRDDGDRDGGRLRLSSCASASGPKSSWACDDRPGPLRVLSQLPTRAQATSGSFNWSALPAGFQPQRLPAPGEGPLLSYGACRHPAPALHGLSGPLYTDPRRHGWLKHGHTGIASVASCCPLIGARA